MAVTQPKLTKQKTFSSDVAKALGIKNIKILIAVNSSGKEFLFIPEGTEVYEYKRPPPPPPPSKSQTAISGKPKMHKYTYPDGDPGWCWPTPGGGIKCYP